MESKSNQKFDVVETDHLAWIVQILISANPVLIIIITDRVYHGLALVELRTSGP